MSEDVLDLPREGSEYSAMVCDKCHVVAEELHEHWPLVRPGQQEYKQLLCGNCIENAMCEI